MRFFRKRNRAVDYGMIIVGTLIMAIAIQCIYDPMNMVTGGVSGLSIVVKSFSSQYFEGGIPLWVTNLVLNIPLFIIAYFVKGKKFIGRTFFATMMLTAWLAVIPAADLSQNDYVLSTLFGGAFTGVGIGLVFYAKATTGGTDMLAAIIQHYLRHYSVAQIMQVIDAAVIVLGVVVFGIKPAMYAIVAVLIVTYVSDAILEGARFSKGVFIISDKRDEIAQSIFEVLDRGATGLAATGLYTGEERGMLYCVVGKKQLVLLNDIVYEADPKAFIIVSDVREVFGEGFIEYSKDV